MCLFLVLVICLSLSLCLVLSVSCPRCCSVLFPWFPCSCGVVCSFQCVMCLVHGCVSVLRCSVLVRVLFLFVLCVGCVFCFVRLLHCIGVLDVPSRCICSLLSVIMLPSVSPLCIVVVCFFVIVGPFS